MCVMSPQGVSSYAGNNLHPETETVPLLYCPVETWNWICNLQASGKRGVGGELK